MPNQIILAGEIGCSSFDLRKMSKGYNWNIKIYHSDIERSYQLAKGINQQATQDFKSADDDKEEPT